MIIKNDVNVHYIHGDDANDDNNSVWNISHGSNKTTKYVITKTDKNIAKAWMMQILQVVFLTRHLPKLK